MKVKMLGVNSAFAVGTYNEDGSYNPKWQSNFLLEFQNGVFGRGKSILKNPYGTLRLLIDQGGDARHGLKFFNLTPSNVHINYFSHCHSDHVGGTECLGLSTFFNPFLNEFKKAGLENYDYNILNYLSQHGEVPNHWKPIALGESEVLKDVWKAFSPGLDTLQGVRRPTLQTYFDVINMDETEEDFWIEEEVDGVKRRWVFYTVESTHVVSGTKHMPSFGLFFQTEGKKLYFPTDTMLMMPPSMKHFYDEADFIYQDTETGFKSGVHSHIDDIKKVDPSIKKKLYLYHYNEEPEVEEGEFAGVLKRGEIHEY